MLENGFVKLHRSLLKWEWYDDLNTFKLFMHLLLTVNYYDRQWRGKTLPVIIIHRQKRLAHYQLCDTCERNKAVSKIGQDCNQTLDFDRRGGKGIKF